MTQPDVDKIKELLADLSAGVDMLENEAADFPAVAANAARVRAALNMILLNLGESVFE